MSAMKGSVLLVLLLKCFPQSDSCELVNKVLICNTIPAEFPPGVSNLFLQVQDVGEMNSSVFHHDSLASVTSVSFKKAGITDIADGAFSSFLNLTSLELDENKLTHINSKWLGRPEILTELGVSQNGIRVLSRAMMEGFTNLKKLNLNRNRIFSVELHTFSGSSRLLLDLSHNNLTQLTSEMFGPLHSIQMSLQGNPWQCSCDARDSLDFIMDLKNRSALVQPDEVTCANPSSLRGELVWNVSVCSTVSPGPPPITLTTSQDLTVSRQTTSRKATLIPRTLHGSDLQFGTHQPPPYTKNIVPMLSTVIVVLCVLLLVIVLAVLFRRKRSRKTVAPRDQSERVTVEKEHQQRDVAEHIVTLSSASFTGARAKSANAILFTSPFGVSGDVHVGSALGQDGENDGENEVDCEIESDILAEVDTNDKSVAFSDRILQNETDLQMVNCENVPYLSIGSKPNQPEYTTVDTHSPLAKLGRGMHRISTWPPTAAQWQERCKREKELEEVDEMEKAWTQVEFKVPGHLDKKGNLPNDVPHKSDFCQLDGRFEGEEQNDKGPWRNNAENKDYCKEDEMQTVKGLEDTSSLGVAESSSTISGKNETIFRNSLINAETPEKDHTLKAVSASLQMSNTSTDRSDSSVSSRRRGSRRRGSRRSTSDALSGAGNEHVFVDLLHEVVQNRGRWTRDRWRQIHRNTQEQQGSGQKSN